MIASEGTERGGAKAALVTGGSSGIGLAIARMLGEEGHGITLSARRPDKLEQAVAGLAAAGIDVQGIPAQVTEESEIEALVGAHQSHFGRLDALINNAGVGIAEYVDEISARKLDMQIGVNLRGLILTTRECMPMLRASGAEHGKALVVNTASIAGKEGQAWTSVYSATKGGVVSFSQGLQKECAGTGIQVTALCPGWVDTPMATFKEDLAKEEMIRPEDIAEAVRFTLRTSRNCVVPEIPFLRSGGEM
jgi:NAD(P)-dependent dehydrogenase (short-subunit alcohol dehydrogenase family)